MLIGSENSAGYKMHYAAPNAAIISLNSPSTPDYIAWTSAGPFKAYANDSVFRGTLGATFLEVGGNNDAKRITYFTPRFAGFQIGVSYAHDDKQDNFGPTDLNASTTVGHIFDIGANYVKSFGSLNVAISGRYGTAEHGAYNPTVWGVGANIGFGGFTIGGSFAEANEHNGGVDDGTAFDVGLSYATGPWTFSRTWFHGENGDDSCTVEGNMICFERLSFEEQDTIGAGVDYKLAKGVRLNAFAAYVDYTGSAFRTRGPQTFRDRTRGWVVGTGIGLSW